MNREQFISTYGTDASAACTGTGLFASVALAQAICEGFIGEQMTGLAANHNNFGGIKPDHHWTGATCTLQTHDGPGGSLELQKFCQFDSVADFFRYRVQFLKENSNYTKAGVFAAKTPQEQAQCLQNAHYSQNPNYPHVIDQLIKLYNLTQYDI